MKWLLAIWIVATMGACSRPSVEGPAEVLDKRVSRVSGTPLLTLTEICRQADIPCGVENARQGLTSTVGQRDEVDLRDMTVRAAVRKVLRKKPGFACGFDHGVMNVRPVIPTPGGPLDKLVPPLEIKNELSTVAMRRAMEAAGISASSGGIGISSPGEPARISLAIASGTVREALNRIAEVDGHVLWYVGYLDTPGGVDQPLLGFEIYKPAGGGRR